MSTSSGNIQLTQLSGRYLLLDCSRRCTVYCVTRITMEHLTSTGDRHGDISDSKSSI